MIKNYSPYISREEDDEEMKGIEDWVYPKTRMVDGERPRHIYIPTKMVMFDIMRASIEKKSVSQIV